MRILLTNDDGIMADGLVALATSVSDCVRDEIFPTSTKIIVVAPDRGRSECGHSVTTGRALKRCAVDGPLKASKHHANIDWYSVDGTPVDCVRVAVSTLAGKTGFDLALSGVNAGANLGTNIHVSGTFAAAREAAIFRIPAMALSHYRKPSVPITWDHVSDWTRQTISDFLVAIDGFRRRDKDMQSPPLWNLNLPAVMPKRQSKRSDSAGWEIPERKWCRVDTQPIPHIATMDGDDVHFDVDFHNRPRTSGHDIDHCFGGSITVSKLSPEPTEAV